MAVVTKLSVKDIQLILRNSPYCDQRNDIVVPNVSWGLLPYEADLIAVKKTGTCTEFEIKRSFDDFKKDFEKDHQHDAEIVTNFYYVVPEKIKDKVIDFLTVRYEDNKNRPAVLYFTEDGNLNRCKYKDDSYGNEKKVSRRKISDEERMTLGRLASLRYWNTQEEMCALGRSPKDIKIDKLNQYLKYVKKSVKELSAKTGFDRWIKCSENLPENDRTVLIQSWFGRIVLGYYDNEYRIWKDEKDKPLTITVYCWTDVPTQMEIKI